MKKLLSFSLIMIVSVMTCIIEVNADYDIKGDLRYRFEDRNSDSSDISDKSRERIRARIGVYGDVTETMSFGTRLASGGDSPISTNQDIDGSASTKGINLDLAYFTIDSLLGDSSKTTFGKMKQPWKSVSDLVFDTDVNPEGISASFSREINNAKLFYQFGHFTLDEAKGDDAKLGSAQIVLENDAGLVFGVSYYGFSNMENASLNDKSAAGLSNTISEYSLFESFAKMDLNDNTKLFANYVANTDADDNDTAYMIGIGTKQGDWAFDYNYREVGLDAIYDEWADSDFHDGGTGGSGHKFKVKRSLAKNLSAGATYFLTETESGDAVNTLQLDLVSKF